jgi:energy-coupling factor transport system permease protein
MALKDITLGQYFPGNSFIHQLDPRTKLLFTVLYIVALFSAKRLPSYLLLMAVLAVCIQISRVRLKTILRGMKPILFIIVLTAILNLFYTPGDPIWQWKFLKITVEGIWAAIYMVLRISMLITCTFLLTYTTSPILLTDGLEKLLGPLKKLRVPVHELSMMMSIALRFIPTSSRRPTRSCPHRRPGAPILIPETSSRRPGPGALLVPLFISAFRRADELAIAMECRCYHGGEGRTRLRQLIFVRRDYLALAGSLFMVAAVYVLRYLGW